MISSSTSSSSSSSSVAPSENVTLSADKTVLALGESSKVTIHFKNKGDVISLKVVDDSLVEGAIVKNEDGSYSVGMSEEATYGGILGSQRRFLYR